ncbi:sensor histidine kinase [Rhodanobacter hydrolyticus]|uniref:histidine kinase n=1 Tax=Rhodanobacter hydrolyticus TaxID=2250595 RepID=A0ABW8JDK1_9GAMM
MRWLVVWGLLLAAGLLPCRALAEQGCMAHIVAVQAARAPDGARPAQGWESVKLPDGWDSRWPGYDGSAWYRIDWMRDCASGADAAQPMGLGIDGMNMAGEVFINDDLLWRDASLVEPLSRSWNIPRWWPLPASSLHAGMNTVWVRLVGVSALSPGLWGLRIGPAAEVEAVQVHHQWRQRRVFDLSAGLSMSVGCLFGVVWCLRRKERAFGWYALMSLAWMAYLYTILATSSWPFANALGMSRVNVAVFAFYVLCFCLFTWRFGGQAIPRVERTLWGLTIAGAAAVLLAPVAMVPVIFPVVWLSFALVFFATCLQFQWHAWRTREPQHVLLALCWLVFVVVGVHDLLMVFGGHPADESWAAVAAPVTTVCMALLLGGRLATGMRRIEGFNAELMAHVEQARAELALVLAREHAHALDHAKLQERMEIAHDLHDGLGGSLMRSMALLEQSVPLPNERVLSMLKVLHDDLREVIDHGSSVGASVPDTPVQWVAPLRHRFTHIFDEMEVDSAWQVAPHWQGQPSALQCIGLTRLVQEALANVIKHSRARRVRVDVETRPGRLTVRVADDGRGFDVEAVRSAGISVGMRSMAARAERLGASFDVDSGAGGTVVESSITYPLAGQ